MSSKTLSLDAFLAANGKNQPACSLDGFLKTLSTTDAKEVRKAIADPRVQASAIIRVIKPLGFTFSRQVIERHRRNGCVSCGMESW